jgi:hypothetical protein
MTTKVLLIVMAIIEVGAGVALVAVPSACAELLLGEGLTAPPSLVVARIAGAALISVGFMCWRERHGERPSQSSSVAGILIYNLAVPIVLVHAWFAWGLHGIALWPASLLHTGLSIWCVACLRPIR